MTTASGLNCASFLDINSISFDIEEIVHLSGLLRILVAHPDWEIRSGRLPT